MALIRQTIRQKKLSLWKVLFMICGPIYIMNIAIKLFSRFNPVIATVGGLVTFLGAVVACVVIIYNHVAYFNYKIIDDELIMEKVFGRASHLFLTLKLNDLEQFKPYDEINMQKVKNEKVKVYKFVSGRNTQEWYAGEFTRSGDRYMFIIEPNKELLNTILSFNTQS
ncbi:hypothetical protein FQB35_14610 [Crassaminicella thermophila]|uniref:Uncharacterized protein n=1 Tax=Crassaminicella thermophila TaxID=2599308 RepID=A0A5C0SIX9_CRATE|nr:hypothetical protein [Crassaminicella thermophila]QEK13404.1 hypothetical protein FQB35_14610 [Crassaminicella thermophila]